MPANIPESAYAYIRVIFNKRVIELFIHFRLNVVVSVNKTEISPGSCLDSVITCIGETAVRFMDDLYTVVLFCVLVAYCAAVIR